MHRNLNNQRYIQAAGGANGLYNVDRLKYHDIVVLVEGEIDALTILSHISTKLPNVTAVATGSTEGARVLRWLFQLELADKVLLAFDNDGQAGNKAADFWINLLRFKGVRLLPTRKDVNQMAQEGDDILTWITNSMYKA